MIETGLLMRKRNCANRENGFSQIELTVVILISGLLILSAATAFSIFFPKYEELSKSSELQKGAFEALQTIKYGGKVGRDKFVFLGVMSADSLVFTNGSMTQANGIKLRPGYSDLSHQNDFVTYSLVDKHIRMTYLYGQVSPASPEYIFPKKTKKNSDIEVTKLLFTKINQGSSAKLIRVVLEARVKLSKNKYRYVSYSTIMGLDTK